MEIDWSVALGLGLGIVSFGAGILAWSYPRSSKRQLTWTWRARSSLVAEGVQAFPELVVTFEGQHLPQLTLLNGKVWNGGAGAIVTDQLRGVRFQAKNQNILGAWLTSETSSDCAVQIRVVEDGTAAELSFDFLNTGDGCEVSILHDGSIETQVTLGGSIIGGYIHQAIGIDPPDWRPRFWHVALMLLIFWGTAGLLALLVQVTSDDPITANAAHVLVIQAIDSMEFKVFGAIVTVGWLFFVMLFARMRLERAAEPQQGRLRPTSTKTQTT